MLSWLCRARGHFGAVAAGGSDGSVFRRTANGTAMAPQPRPGGLVSAARLTEALLEVGPFTTQLPLVLKIWALELRRDDPS